MRPRRMYVFILLALVFFGCSGARAGECRDEVLGGVYPALSRNTLGERTTLLCNMAFIEMVSGVSHDPLWSAEHLTRDEILSARHQVRRGIFHEETRQPMEDRATLSDYRRSGFDRGHMTPSGDAPTALAQQQTFSLANMVPQTPDLNRGPWAGIEQAVRDLARREGEVYVVTGPAFRTDHVVTIGRSHVYVPTSVWKAVYRPSLRGAGVYVCRNLVTPTCDRVPVAALIRVTGIDPFPGLSDDVKARLVDLPDWRVPHYHVAPKLRRQTLDVLGQVLTRWLGQFGTE